MARGKYKTRADAETVRRTSEERALDAERRASEVQRELDNATQLILDLRAMFESETARIVAQRDAVSSPRVVELEGQLEAARLKNTKLAKDLKHMDAIYARAMDWFCEAASFGAAGLGDGEASEAWFAITHKLKVIVGSTYSNHAQGETIGRLKGSARPGTVAAQRILDIDKANGYRRTNTSGADLVPKIRIVVDQ